MKQENPPELRHTDNGNIPSGFDWVRARSACSLPNVFKDLRLGVEHDIKTRNDLRPQSAPYHFSVAESDGGFKALLHSDTLQTAVTFILSDHAIQVRDHLCAPMFEVTLDFDDHGKCRLRVGDRNYELWQIQRMALEELIFRSL